MRHILLLIFLTLPSFATADDDDLGGTLNPEELTLGHNILMAEQGQVDMTICASGYMMTKAGRHDLARKVFTACAEAGFTSTMTWMAYMEQNGFGGDGEFDPDQAALWDKRAAEAGDPVGKFNHGLNLMRGFGVAQDPALGKSFVQDAAKDGLEIAQRLIDADFDLDEVTPDADNWRYAPVF